VGNSDAIESHSYNVQAKNFNNSTSGGKLERNCLHIEKIDDFHLSIHDPVLTCCDHKQQALINNILTSDRQ